MANQIIRPTVLPPRASPVASEVTVSDNGASVAGVTWADGVNAAAPVASQLEAEAGVDNSKRMTPLTAKQAIDAQVPPKISSAIAALNLGSASQSQASDFATAAQGALADAAVQPSDLSSVATSGNYEDLSNKPTARLIPAGGLTSQSLVKSSDSDYDTQWSTSAAATAVSYAPQTLTDAQRAQARANIGVGSVVFSAVNSANQPRANGTSKATFDSITIGGGFANSRFTAPVDGRYLVSTTITIGDGTVNAGSWGPLIYVNGANSFGIAASKTRFYDAQSVSEIINLSVGDYVEVFVFLDAFTGNPRLEANRCNFNGFLIG